MAKTTNFDMTLPETGVKGPWAEQINGAFSYLDSMLSVSLNADGTLKGGAGGSGGGASGSAGNLDTMARVRSHFHNSTTAMLIPFYVYPTPNVWADTRYIEVMNSARENPDVAHHIVVAPSTTGPGNAMDPTYLRAIRRLRGAGCYVHGYVATGYGATSAATVKARVDTWLSFYGKIDGIFYDEMQYDDNSTGTQAATISYYKDIKEYAHNKGCQLVIANPGTTVPSIYFDQDAADVIMTHETGQYPTGKYAGNWADSYMEVSRYRRVGMVYNQADITLADVASLSREHGFIYISHLNLPNPWNGLPNHWATQIQAIKDIAYDGPRVKGLNKGSTVTTADAMSNTTKINTTILAAWAAKEANGGVVIEIPEGVYSLGGPIVLQDDITLKGQGIRGTRATVLKPSSTFPINTALIESPNFSAHNQWMAGYNASAGVGYTPGAPTSGIYNPATKPIPTRILFSGIEGIHLDGSDICAIGVGIVGLECVIQNNTMRYFTTSGIKIGGWTPTAVGVDVIPYLSLNNVINNNFIIKNAGTGVKMAGPCLHEASYTADTRIQNNYIEGSHQAGVFSGGSNCRIQANHIFDCLNGIESRDSHEKFILDNYIENINSHGILVFNGASWEDGLSAIISNNILRNVNTGQFFPGVNQNAANAAAGKNVNVCISRAAIMIYEVANRRSLDKVIITNNILRRDASDPNAGAAWVDTPTAPFWNSTVARGKVPYMIAVVAGATNQAGTLPAQVVSNNNIAQGGIATLALQNLALARAEADISVW